MVVNNNLSFKACVMGHAPPIHTQTNKSVEKKKKKRLRKERKKVKKKKKKTTHNRFIILHQKLKKHCPCLPSSGKALSLVS